MSHLLAKLQCLQDETVRIVKTIAEKDYHQQFHPDLSPTAWHLGHCVYTEVFWIKEQLLGQQAVADPLKSSYAPELSAKKSRGSVLPNKQALLVSAAATQAENRRLLEIATTQLASHRLLKDDFLLYFLCQHYSQHIETMMMTLTELQMSDADPLYSPPSNLQATRQKPAVITIASGPYNIGSANKHCVYDNEQPQHTVAIDRFNIAIAPVSNSEYLAFINAGGYSRDEYWSEAGWAWCRKTRHTRPHHWRQHKHGAWYGIGHAGAYALAAQAPVYGLSYFEAAAYARWAGARLPHEYEWEVAATTGKLQLTKRVWEWCNNTFHPYAGFSPYPYAGYSTPCFDDHYVLKGGSQYTKEHIIRPSFRNFYKPDKRHIFAGCRLVYD